VPLREDGVPLLLVELAGLLLESELGLAGRAELVDLRPVGRLVVLVAGTGDGGGALLVAAGDLVFLLRLVEGLGLVLERMLAKDRRDRYTDPAELVADLERVLEDKSPRLEGLESGKSSLMKVAEFRKAAERLAKKRRERLTARRGSTTLVVGVVLGLGIAVGVAVLLIRSDSEVGRRAHEFIEGLAGKRERGWIPLFDGKSLTQEWRTYRSRGWTVGERFVESAGREPGRIETIRVLSDYGFRAEVALSRDGEAWLVFAKPRGSDRGGFRVRLPARGLDEWTRIEARAETGKLAVAVAGEPVTPRPVEVAAEGVAAFEAKRGTLRLRDVMVRPGRQDRSFGGADRPAAEPGPGPGSR
jgi:hypothetical protein